MHRTGGVKLMKSFYIISLSVLSLCARFKIVLLTNLDVITILFDYGFYGGTSVTQMYIKLVKKAR